MINSKLFSSINRKVLIFFYVLVIIWWFTIFIRGIRETNENYAFSLLYTIIPLIWGMIGFVNARRWGGLKSSAGRAIYFLSMGILAWGIGNLIFAYYNLVLRVPVPYPSVADVFFILIYPLSAIGIVFLFRVTGAYFALRSLLGKIAIFIIPLCLSLLSYYLLVVVARGGAITYEGNLLKLILDVAYPIGDIVVISLTIIVYGLSVKLLGGIFRMPVVLILIGFISNYFADFLFSYTTTTGTYFVGLWVDLFYPTAFLLIGVGLSLMDPRRVSVKTKDQLNR